MRRETGHLQSPFGCLAFALDQLQLTELQQKRQVIGIIRRRASAIRSHSACTVGNLSAFGWCFNRTVLLVSVLLMATLREQCSVGRHIRRFDPHVGEVRTTVERE